MESAPDACNSDDGPPERAQNVGVDVAVVVLGEIYEAREQEHSVHQEETCECPAFERL